MSIVTKMYLETKKLPKEEKFGLISQMRRCAVSIPSNIAEGASRSSEKEFYRFLEIAQGSAFELETQILVCRNLNYLSEETTNQLNTLLDVIQRQLNGMRKVNS